MTHCIAINFLESQQEVLIVESIHNQPSTDGVQPVTGNEPDLLGLALKCDTSSIDETASDGAKEPCSTTITDLHSNLQQTSQTEV